MYFLSLNNNNEVINVWVYIKKKLKLNESIIFLNFKWDDVDYTFIIFVYKKKITKFLWNETQSVASHYVRADECIKLKVGVGEDQEWVNELNS